MPRRRWTPSTGNSTTARSIPSWPRLADSATRRFVEINAGPWDRLDDNRPFVPGVGERPQGAELYPHDMTKEEFERAAAASPAAAAALRSTYTVVRRDSSRRPGGRSLP